ncbi:hypothetical protein PoB_002077600 [Plakobranchus ocellatus]|uniref:Uncharacterized protein n=1 Tax=Plakobranchus ocellatus TaxID=259542 RepID=A0AAV3ZI11_9GAST|nr:hypothetical protein PoB_002077600 [Plakobranchus ocellatus]
MLLGCYHYPWLPKSRPMVMIAYSPRPATARAFLGNLRRRHPVAIATHIAGERVIEKMCVKAVVITFVGGVAIHLISSSYLPFTEEI